MAWLLQLVRGGALAALFGVAALAVALFTGLTSGTSLFLYPLAALVAVAFALIDDGETTPQLVGAIGFGLVALLLGVATGFGALEISGVVGSAVSAVVIGWELPWRARIPAAVLAGLVLVLMVANLVPLILDGGGLNHDESAYALKARHWIEGTPETGWNLHRGIAMSLYGFLVLEAGGDEATLRIWGLAAIVVFVAATWILGNRIGGGWVGPVAAIALMSAPALLRRSTEYLSDVPSAALLTACMAVVWRQFGQKDRPGYGLLWLLPLALGAFYVRYQSVLSFALIAVAIAVLFWEKVKVGWRPIALTAGLGLAGLVPHFLFSISETGNPLGIMLFTADVAGREYFGEGLVDYFLYMGFPLAAFVGPLAVVFFIWWLVVGWASVAARTKALFLMIPAAGQVLILGVLSHGEERFVFFPLALTIVGGAAGLSVLLRRWSPMTARAVSLAMAVLLLGSFAMSAAYVRRAVDGRILGTEPVLLAAEEMRDSSDDDSCGVMTSYLPQITYYSTCYTQPFRTHLDPEEALSRVQGDDRFLLLVEDGKRQPTGEDLSELVELTTGEAIVVEGQRDSAEIYDFLP